MFPVPGVSKHAAYVCNSNKYGINTRMLAASQLGPIVHMRNVVSYRMDDVSHFKFAKRKAD